MSNFHIKPLENLDAIQHLKTQWLQTLTSPQDGMWEAFRSQAQHWTVTKEDQLIGYACTDGQNQIIQYFILTPYLPDSNEIFRELLNTTGSTFGIVGTNNPIFHSTALHFLKSLSIHSYLFREILEVELPDKEGVRSLCQMDELKSLVDFCHLSVGAPKEWLSGYLSNLIEREELHALRHQDSIIGTCEVRKSDSNTSVADIGMIVSPDYRRQGYGTYLLYSAKQIATQQGRQPICSCEKDNIGSLKSIHKAGLSSTHQLLSIEFHKA